MRGGVGSSAANNKSMTNGEFLLGAGLYNDAIPETCAALELPFAPAGETGVREEHIQRT